MKDLIFETERLWVRKLDLGDILPFHEMQSNPKVMRYATGEVKSLKAHEKELQSLLKKYETPNNNFWIYAIERKSDAHFLGTLALVKDGKDDEIGYRFLEKYWGNGYASEVCKGLITYCKSLPIEKLVGYVIDKNIASTIILKKLHFIEVEKLLDKDTALPETKYELILR